MRRLAPLGVVAIALAATIPAVNAAAGDAVRPRSSPTGSPGADAAVTFRVMPVVLLVVDRHGRPLQLWSNLRTLPSTSELRAVRVRAGGVHGPRVPAGPSLRAEAAQVAAEASWGRPGLVWSRP